MALCCFCSAVSGAGMEAEAPLEEVESAPEEPREEAAEAPLDGRKRGAASQKTSRPLPRATASRISARPSDLERTWCLPRKTTCPLLPRSGSQHRDGVRRQRELGSGRAHHVPVHVDRQRRIALHHDALRAQQRYFRMADVCAAKDTRERAQKIPAPHVAD